MLISSALNPGNKERGLTALLTIYGKSDRITGIQKFIRDRMTLRRDKGQPSQELTTTCVSDSSLVPTPTQEANPFAVYTEAPIDLSSDIALWTAYNSADPVFAAVKGRSLIDYWRRVKRTGRFNPLCMLVRDILGLSVASTSVERLFSHTNNVLGRKRNTLTPRALIHQTTVRMLIREGKDGKVQGAKSS
jgi:hypothetical protein